MVRNRDALEPFRGGGVVEVLVWVVLNGEAAVGAFDVVLGGGGGEEEEVVVFGFEGPSLGAD